MGVLTYNLTAEGWTGTVTINYTVVYNAAKNQTTVTFTDSNHSYFGRNGYYSEAATNITVTAADNPSSSGTATLSTSGNTNGGVKSFSGTPSPSSVTVQHSSGSGVKKITVSGTSTFYVAIYSSSTAQSTLYGNGSVTDNIITAYALSTSIGTGCSATVSRTSSSIAATGNLSNGALIFSGDVLKITFSASTGYSISTHTVNGSAFTSGSTYTVSGNVSVVAKATVKSYTLSVNAGTGSKVTVNRTSSPKAGAATGNIANGAKIYYSDVLKVTYSANAGYTIDSATLNGSNITSGSTHMVSAAVAVAIYAKLMGGIQIGNGTSYGMYLLYIGNGTSWEQLVPYIADGTSYNVIS